MVCTVDFVNHSLFRLIELVVVKTTDFNIVLMDDIADADSGFALGIDISDGVRKGGLGSAVLEWMNDHGYHPEVIRLGLPDAFVEHGKVCELNKIVGLDAESIAKAIIV